jgi:secondary thiamine-phosphate synthase enzyme
LTEGFAVVFVMSSTSSIAIMEWEDGLVRDLRSTFERIAPEKGDYEHEKAWHDGNGHSHMRATLLGQSLSIPFSNGELLLGTWQQVILVEFDVRKRNRRIIVQVHGM